MGAFIGEYLEMNSEILYDITNLIEIVTIEKVTNDVSDNKKLVDGPTIFILHSSLWRRIACLNINGNDDQRHHTEKG